MLQLIETSAGEWINADLVASVEPLGDSYCLTLKDGSLHKTVGKFNPATHRACDDFDYLTGAVRESTVALNWMAENLGCVAKFAEVIYGAMTNPGRLAVAGEIVGVRDAIIEATEMAERRADEAKAERKAAARKAKAAANA